VELRSAWRSFEALFVPDNYSAELLASMATSDRQMQATFASLARLMSGKGIKVGLRINEVPVEATAVLPPAPWRRFELSASRLSAAVEKGQEFVAAELTELALTFLNLVLALLPVEEVSGVTSDSFVDGLPEGAKTRVEVNRYERNPANRAACIAAHGTRCKTCGFDFAEVYGPIGDDYIEVHHTTPVSAMGSAYVVDPTREMVPLCANCHAVVHRRNPPLSVEELIAIISEKREKTAK
jgi:5-methylcytosine-specific restriction protein A